MDPMYLKLRSSGVQLMIRRTHTNQCDVIRECVSVCKRERESERVKEEEGGKTVTPEGNITLRPI